MDPDFSKFKKMSPDGQPEPVSRTDERFQAVLLAELVDFFGYYHIINARLRWLLNMYDFKNFDEIRNYYEEYIIPQLNAESEYESESNLPG